MKCHSCQTEVIIRDGEKKGYCHGCGQEFKVGENGEQINDPGFVDRLADSLAPKVAELLKPPAEPPDPDDPPDSDDPPAEPEGKWDK